MRQRPILLAAWSLLAFRVGATAAEAPVTCTAEQVARCVAEAPSLPAAHPDLDLGLRLRLVDYIDFTKPDDPHDRIDRGTSRVTKGPAGTYRVTAAHRHAQFAVRWKADRTDAPHVLVFEYPDDAKREIAFFTHESPLSGRKNIDWSLETGVYCGNPLPLSGTMRYHTFFFWPTDAWPVAMVMNWARSGAPAAASRLWVFAVDGGLPPLDVAEPDPAAPRHFGTLYNWSLVPTRGVFGLANADTALAHLAEYHRYRGDNVLSWPVVANNTWGFRCQVPAWDGGSGTAPENVELDRVLKVCEANGLRFLPVINAGEAFKIGGARRTDANRDAYSAGFRLGMEQFIQRYGASPALLGIAFDTQDLSPTYGEAGLDNVRACFGSLDAFTAFLRAKAPRLKAFTFVGGRHIHDQYFDNAGDVIGRWERTATPWSDFLSMEVGALWTSWQRAPVDLNRVVGLTPVTSYQSDDHAIFDTYHQNPRAMFYRDLEDSPAKAALLDTRAAMVWNTFFEGYIGLQPRNWWYQKVWVAPDFNPAPPSALAGWTRALQHRDRDMLLCGAWNRKGSGHEAALRRFARAFRALPAAELAPVAVTGSSPVLVRAGTHEGRTTACAVNPTPFPATIRLDVVGQTHELTVAPFGIESIRADAAGAVSATGEVSADYARWVGARLRTFESLCSEVRSLDSAAVPPAFVAHLARAKGYFEQKRFLDADMALGHGLTTELELRRRILAPPRQAVPRLAGAPPLNGDLDGWPAASADLRSDDANLGAHLFFTSQWEGLSDLSARVRLGHDGAKLYIGIAVKDDMLCPKDGLTLCLSAANYRHWLPQDLKYETRLDIGLPLAAPQASGTGADGFAWTSRRTADGYIAEGTLDMAALRLAPGARLGWILQASDDDNTPLLANESWARKSVLLMPNEPAFAYWQDARSCGEWIIE